MFVGVQPFKNNICTAAKTIYPPVYRHTLVLTSWEKMFAFLRGEPLGDDKRSCSLSYDPPVSVVDIKYCLLISTVCAEIIFFLSLLRYIPLFYVIIICYLLKLTLINCKCSHSVIKCMQHAITSCFRAH